MEDSDPNDTAGSLINFIVSDDDPVLVDETESEVSVRAEADQLMAEFPYRRDLLEVTPAPQGPRRSGRTRRAVQRYQDPEYVELMLHKGGEVDLSLLAHEEDDEQCVSADDSDMSYRAEDDDGISDDDD